MGDSELLIAINQTPPNCIVLMEVRVAVPYPSDRAPR